MKHAKLREYLASAYRLANRLPLRHWEVRAYIGDVLHILDDIETGPENSRDEVSPSGRSPQRDCPAARLAAAL